MATPENLTATAIETIVMNALRLPTSNTTELGKIRDLINAVYRDIYLKHDWWWMLKTQVVNTTAKVAHDGTMSVTLGSTAITASTAISLPIQHYALILTGNANDPNAVYRITTTTTSGTGTALVVDAGITAATSTAAGYELYEDKIKLSADVGKMGQIKRFGGGLPIRLIGQEMMMQLKIQGSISGRPEWASVFEFATSGDPTTQRWLWLHPYPDKAYRLEILYKQQLNTELSSTTQPFMPDEYRQLLVYGALARGYPIYMDDLERAKFFQALFNDLMALMQAAQREYASDLPHLYPDESYRDTRRTRGRRGRVSLGSYFGRLPYEP